MIEQGITYCHHHHNQTSSPPLNTDIVHTSLPSVRVHALLSFRDSVVNVRCLCRDVRGSLCRVHSSTSFLPFLEFHQLLRFSPGARHSFQFRAHSRAPPPPLALSPFSALRFWELLSTQRMESFVFSPILGLCIVYLEPCREWLDELVKVRILGVHRER